MLRKSQINFCIPKIETIWLVLCHITLHLWRTPPVDLHLILGKWNLKKWSSGLFRTWILQATQAVKKEFVKIHFSKKKFKNQLQIISRSVVNMKVHTDPKNSYMHPFVWQSITVEKFFYPGWKKNSHQIYTIKSRVLTHLV